MYGECLSCKEDVSSLMNWDTLCEDFIECPSCKTKMVVEYDESWDGEEENSYWWLELYNEEK